MTTPGPAKPMVDLLRGSGPRDYGPQEITGAVLTSLDPVTHANIVTDGVVRYSNLPAAAPWSQIAAGQVFLLKTAGLPVILGNVYKPTISSDASSPVVVGPGAMGDAELLWSDEFTGSSLSLATDTGGGTWRTKGYEGGGSVNTGYTDFAGSSWNVSPGQHPAAFPVTVENSILTLTAKRNPGLSGVTNDWIGAYLVTNNVTGLTWRFGYFEWRARFPVAGRGMFPALWMFNNIAGRSDGKEGAEIDMFEIFGEPDGQPWSSGYHNRPVPGVGFNAGNFNSDTAGWHRYGLEWTSTALRYYKDGAQVAEVTGSTAEWFQTADLGIRINYAMDPNWLTDGDPNKSTDSDPPEGTELRMEVDYVRVFDHKPTVLPIGSADPLSIPSGQYQYFQLTNPTRIEARNTQGTLLATFTEGSRTVTLAGPSRTFTEAKAPFLDEFDRVITTGWGTSPNGGKWGDFNGSSSDYSVSGGKGCIACPTTNVSRYVRLNDIVSIYDVRTSVTTSTTPAGAANSCSLIGGFQSTTNHYRYRLTFNSTGSVAASINVVVDGTETTIAGPITVAASGYVANQVWHIRAVFNGTTHSLYAWKDGDSEPGSPTLSIADTTYMTGKLGVRVLASTGSTNFPTFLIDDYQGSATWATPPFVTQSTYVRLLPVPFTGTVDEVWLTSALADTSPDLLGIAMEYITGGSKNAGYGPPYAPGRSFELDHADDGTRQEGADWNDYLGVTGNYPDLAVPSTDTPEAHQLGCLDCSGLVRTVFGFRGGLPMCLDDPADYDGLRIPRRSVDQSSDGPGVSVVFSASSVPTDLSAVLPGDVLYWDADTTNPAEEEGQIDHSGIYLGLDSTGQMRFLSSRKTANGPTLSDLGGPSVLTGTSLYGRSLRRVRRF